MLKGIRAIFGNGPDAVRKQPAAKPSIVAIVNQKGGCGKTTTCINLASGLAKKGFKVLIIDLDPQANCSLGLGVGIHNIAFSTYDVIVGSLELERAITPTYHRNLDIVPASSKFTGAQLEIADLLGREGLLRTSLYRCLNTARAYDYVLMDCSPSLNLITINGLTASQHVLIPVQPHYFSLEGMRDLFSTIETVRDRLNAELEVLGILVALYNKNIRMNREVFAQLEGYFKEKVFKTPIRMNSRLVEATANGRSVLDFDPKSHGAEDYRGLCDEVIARTRPFGVPSSEFLPAADGKWGVHPA